MKRFLAILLLCQLLLFHGGYFTLYWLANHRIENYWETFESPTAENLQKISIPMKIPYKANQTEYLLTEGKISLDGKVFRAMYQKYDNDTIHILVVEDQLSVHLNKSIQKWIKNSNSTQEHKNRSLSLVSLVKDYQTALYDLQLKEPSFTYTKKALTPYIIHIKSVEREIFLKPPIRLVS